MKHRYFNMVFALNLMPPVIFEHWSVRCDGYGSLDACCVHLTSSPMQSHGVIVSCGHNSHIQVSLMLLLVRNGAPQQDEMDSCSRSLYKLDRKLFYCNGAAAVNLPKLSSALVAPPTWSGTGQETNRRKRQKFTPACRDSAGSCAV